MPEKTFLPDYLLIDGIYTLYYQKKGKEFFFPGEIHKFWELVYMDKGHICLMLDGKEFLLGPGDFMFYTENQNHVFWADKKTSPNFLTVSFDIYFSDKDYFKNKVFKTDNHIKEIFSLILKTRGKAFTGNIYNWNMKVNEKEKEKSLILKQYIKILLTGLMLYLYIDYGSNKPKQNEILNDFNINSNFNPTVKKVIGYIQKNIINKLYIDDICKNAAISRTYLTELFKKNTGMSVIKYINTEKLKKAKQLIRESDMNMSQISDNLGFSSAYYFSNLFKKEYGISPTEYKKSIL